MKRVVLKNGLTVITKSRPTKSVAIEVSVKVGSNYEKPSQRGISHLLEHMIFEGTKTRTRKQIADEIESLGAEYNAATSTERTYFYINIFKRFFNRALEILADIIQNPALDEKAFQKEKKVILDEINLVNDDPKVYQFILFEKTLYKKYPVKNPIYGNAEAIRKITRQDLMDYYKKYYIPNNMVITVSGLGNGVTKKIEKAFTFKKKQLKQIIFPKEPKPKSSRKIEQKNTSHSYISLGYQTVSRKNKDSYILDVIQAILSKGLSSRLFEEIRIKRGLAYDVGAINETNINYGYFVTYVSTDIKHIPLVKELLLKELKLNNPTNKEINDAKTYIEGHLNLRLEHNAEMADWLAAWELVGDIKNAESYLKNIKKVNKKDIQRVVKKYFKNPSYIILKQKS